MQRTSIFCSSTRKRRGGKGRGGILSLFCPCFLGMKRHDVTRNEMIPIEKTEVSEQVAEKI